MKPILGVLGYSYEIAPSVKHVPVHKPHRAKGMNMIMTSNRHSLTGIALPATFWIFSDLRL